MDQNKFLEKQGKLTVYLLSEVTEVRENCLKVIREGLEPSPYLLSGGLLDLSNLVGLHFSYHHVVLLEFEVIVFGILGFHANVFVLINVVLKRLVASFGSCLEFVKVADWENREDFLHYRPLG
jgi:hypothetical protein